jgi:hypothetical protein
MARDKDDVLEVLRDPTIRKIYFSVGPIIVTSGQYRRIYDRVENNKITTSVANVRGTRYDQICSYSAPGNHITLNTGWTRSNLDHRAYLI